MWCDMFLVSDLPFVYGDTEWLIEAGLFADTEEAFEDTNMDKPLWAEGSVPSFKEERREIFTIENASHLAYEIELGGGTYRVPEHTIALRVDEDTWEVYCYKDTLIGSITLSDDGSNKIEINIVDFSK